MNENNKNDTAISYGNAKIIKKVRQAKEILNSITDDLAFAIDQLSETERGEVLGFIQLCKTTATDTAQLIRLPGKKYGGGRPPKDINSHFGRDPRARKLSS